jgi:hypothetical protein|tara:strand:+ start:1517 stop:1630 length:114 start_codon:yes stop_codon:yes gene_type:complete
MPAAILSNCAPEGFARQQRYSALVPLRRDQRVLIHYD